MLDLLQPLPIPEPLSLLASATSPMDLTRVRQGTIEGGHPGGRGAAPEMRLILLNIWEEGIKKGSNGQHEFSRSLLQSITGIHEVELDTIDIQPSRVSDVYTLLFL
jgi:hypothetical protein